jgi:hypothetical protein
MIFIQGCLKGIFYNDFETALHLIDYALEYALANFCAKDSSFVF